MTVKNKQQTTLDAEVTITFLVNDVCWVNDLIEGDENHFREIVEDNLKYEFDWNDLEYHIKEVKKIS